jgi:hypothetical protein
LSKNREEEQLSKEILMNMDTLPDEVVNEDTSLKSFQKESPDSYTMKGLGMVSDDGEDKNALDPRSHLMFEPTVLVDEFYDMKPSPESKNDIPKENYPKTRAVRTPNSAIDRRTPLAEEAVDQDMSGGRLARATKGSGKSPIVPDSRVSERSKRLKPVPVPQEEPRQTSTRRSTRRNN